MCRHTVDKYLDTLLASQTARKAMPQTTDKGVSARWRTAQVIISSILPNESQLSDDPYSGGFGF